MTFENLETSVQDLVAMNELDKAIQLMKEFFKNDPDLDDVLLQSGNYRAILNRQINQSAGFAEVEQALAKLRFSILQLLRSKKEYLKYKELTFGNSDSAAQSGEIRLFFSVGSPFNDAQQHYIDKLIAYFAQHGILLETLKGWNEEDPLLPIIEELKSSSGCLVLALERYYLNDAIEKRGSEQEGRISGKALTSPWLHIEVALARSMDLPLIILKDLSLKNEGLIHDDKQEWGIVRIDHNDLEQLDNYPVKNFMLNWINQVKKYHVSKSK